MHSVSLQPIYDTLNEGLLILLTGLVGWVVRELVAWFQAHFKFLDQQTDAQLAAGLNRALSNGVQIALQQLNVVESQHPGLTTKSAITAFAAQYAINHSPDAMTKFGIDPDDLAEKALAYLPSPSVQIAPGQAAPEKIQVQNLEPLK